MSFPSLKRMNFLFTCLLAVLFASLAVPVQADASAWYSDPVASESGLFGRIRASQRGLGDFGRGLMDSSAGSLISGRSLKVLGLLGTAALVARKHEDRTGLERTIDTWGIIPYLDIYIDLGNVFGDGLVVGGLAAGYYLASRLGGEERYTEVARDMTRVLLPTWAVVWALKMSVNTRRPDGGSHSFPSGHTATAFATATVLSRHHGWKAGTAAYALAVGTGFARLEDNRHHMSDVLFGAAIGLAMGHDALLGRYSRFGFEGISLSTDRVGVVFSF